MSFICKDKAYSSNVWSVMLDASLIYKCVQYLLNSLSWKAVYCFEFIWNVCSRHFDSEYLPYRCTVPLALGHRPPFRASVPLTRDWPPQSTTQWPSPMTTSLSLARSQSGKILRWYINQQMIHSNTFGYGFKRVNYMQKLKKTTTLNSTTDNNSFWFEANTVEFEEYICTCLKKVSQSGLQANISGKNANKCNSPRT